MKFIRRISFLFAAALVVGLALGCNTAKVAPQPLAPGYSSPADQTLGQSLAAVSAFTQTEKVNYSQLPVDAQAKEKPYLNALITAVNIADASYAAFHQGTATLAQAQADYNKAASAQSALITAKGVK